MDGWLIIQSIVSSAARAIVAHMRDWMMGTPDGELVSMGVYSTTSNNSYGVPGNLIYSFPVICKGGTAMIVNGLTLDEFSKKKLEATTKELLDEANGASAFLGTKTTS